MQRVVILIQGPLSSLHHDAHDGVIKVDLSDGDHLDERRVVDDALGSRFTQSVGGEVDDVTVVDRLSGGSRDGKRDRAR